jgi:hypothetical protein
LDALRAFLAVQDNAAEPQSTDNRQRAQRKTKGPTFP